MNTKKVSLFSALVAGLLGMSQTNATVLQSNDVYNDTNKSVTIEVSRKISCVGEQSKTEKHMTTIEPGQTAQVYVMGGSMGMCSSQATELKASAEGVMSAIKTNPEAKNYTVKMQTMSRPPSMVVYKQLILE